MYELKILVTFDPKLVKMYIFAYFSSEEIRFIEYSKCNIKLFGEL